MQKLKLSIILIPCLLILAAGLFAPRPALAALCTGGQTPQTANCDPPKKAVDCPSLKVDPNDPTQCATLGNDCNGNTADTCLQKNSIVKRLNEIVDFLSAAVGIVVIAVIIVGGIQYTLAGDSPDATGKAKTRIMNGLIALAAFLFTFAILQWLIPGGL